MEQIVGSLSGVSCRTFDTLYDLLFTTERIIAYIIQHPNDFEYRPTFKDLFYPGHLMAKRKEQFNRTETCQARRRSLQEKPISELVGLHPLNFEIRYSEVTSVQITRWPFRPHLKLHTSKSPTTEQTVRFTIPREQVADAQRLLKLVLPSKVKER